MPTSKVFTKFDLFLNESTKIPGSNKLHFRYTLEGTLCKNLEWHAKIENQFTKCVIRETHLYKIISRKCQYCFREQIDNRKRQCILMIVFQCSIKSSIIPFLLQQNYIYALRMMLHLERCIKLKYSFFTFFRSTCNARYSIVSTSDKVMR